MEIKKENILPLLSKEWTTAQEIKTTLNIEGKSLKSIGKLIANTLDNDASVESIKINNVRHYRLKKERVPALLNVRSSEKPTMAQEIKEFIQDALEYRTLKAEIEAFKSQIAGSKRKGLGAV